MKKALITSLLLAPSLLVAEEKALDLKAMLDTRIEAVDGYTEESIEYAKETEFTEELTPLEKRIGDEYKKVLKLTRASDNIELKIATLRLELLSEIVNEYYELEYPENAAAKVLAKGKIALYKKQLEEIDAYEKSLKK